ncbi:MAG: polar amino acid transport system substrate-binding protein [Flavobacterium sp.]|jgi:polar amino acid transport system substrate-binding protein
MTIIHRSKYWPIFSALLTCFANGPISAENISNEKFTVLTEQFYPLNYTVNGNNDDKIIGYATELVNDVMANAELDYDLVSVPWTRAVHMIDNKENIIVFSMTRSPEREDKYHWIGEIVPSRMYLFGLSKNFQSLPANVDELKNYRIGSDKHSVASSYLREQGFTNLYNIKNQNYLKQLERGRTDLFPYISFSMAFINHRAGIKRWTPLIGQ